MSLVSVWVWCWAGDEQEESHRWTPRGAGEGARASWGTAASHSNWMLAGTGLSPHPFGKSIEELNFFLSILQPHDWWSVHQCHSLSGPRVTGRKLPLCSNDFVSMCFEGYVILSVRLWLQHPEARRITREEPMAGVCIYLSWVCLWLEKWVASGT